MGKGRRLLTAAATLMSVAAVAGCVSMPSSGPVLAYQPPQDTGVSAQQYLQLNSEPPGTGWDPQQIVEGFLAANGSFADDHKVAREYLTPQFKSEWSGDWSAEVFKDGDVPRITAPPVPKSAHTAVVTVTGSFQARVTTTGNYAVAASTGTGTSSGNKPGTITITLTKTGVGWRISRMSQPSELLLSATDFQANYQQRDLYFFDPHRKYLVADPVYVPVAAVRAPDPEDLLSQLVRDLIKPSADWLINATNTAFPGGTKLVNPVSLNGGIANVNLEGAEIGRAGSAADEQMAAQLVWTLGSADSQPVVTGVQLSINGKPWIPSVANASPVLQKAASKYGPATGEARQSTFYYLDGKGNVLGRSGPNEKAQPILPASAKGPHLTAIAVSPDGKYLAGLSNGTIYTGPIGGRLQSRDSGGFTSLSWDPGDNLWAAGSDGAVVVPPVGAVVPLTSEVGNVTALAVAPDGVRIALVVGGTIQFAAISWETGGSTTTPVPTIAGLSPFEVSGSDISDVTWYGPDNVIALSGSGPGSQATEYPVNGGTPTTVLHQAGMTNITASWNNPLIASTSSGQMLYTESIGGGWGPLSFTGKAAVYPG